MDRDTRKQECTYMWNLLYTATQSIRAYRWTLTHTHIHTPLSSSRRPFSWIWWQQIRLSASSWHLQTKMRTDVCIFMCLFCRPVLLNNTVPLSPLLFILLGIRSVWWFESASVCHLKFRLICASWYLQNCLSHTSGFIVQNSNVCLQINTLMFIYSFGFTLCLLPLFYP